MVETTTSELISSAVSCSESGRWMPSRPMPSPRISARVMVTTVVATAVKVGGKRAADHSSRASGRVAIASGYMLPRCAIAIPPASSRAISNDHSRRSRRLPRAGVRLVCSWRGTPNSSSMLEVVAVAPSRSPSAHCRKARGQSATGIMPATSIPRLPIPALARHSTPAPRISRKPSLVRSRSWRVWALTYSAASQVASALLPIENGRNSGGAGTSSRCSSACPAAMAST